MLKVIAEELSLILVANKIIAIENRKYYIYGIELIINDFLIFFSISVIAIITNTIVISLIFSVTFCALRAYSGGYHCKSYSACFGLTLINYVGMLLLNNLIEDNKFIFCCVIIGFSIPTIIKFAPIEHINNPLDNIQKKKCRRLSLLIVILCIVSFIVTSVFSKLEISFAISWSIFAVWLLMLPTILLEGRKMIMKIPFLRLVANLATGAVKQANNTGSRYWTYQPKAPAGVKDFKNKS